MEDRVDAQAVETIFKFGFPRPRLESKAQAAASVAKAPGSAPTAAAGTAGSAPGPLVGGADGGGPVGKVGRNDPCPCGSGTKYKKCHGA
jgi:preprotein translocase subunit SecA